MVGDQQVGHKDYELVDMGGIVVVGHGHDGVGHAHMMGVVQGHSKHTNEQIKVAQHHLQMKHVTV